MKFHPYADIFPLIEGEDFDALVADIKANGLRQIITLYQGKILDGRNRFLACQKAKVTPKYHKFQGDDDAALAHVVSANVHRRHLTPQQRALAAARVATLRKGANQHTEGASREASSNAPRGALAQDAAAEQFDVSRSSVQRARKVIEGGSKELQRAVDRGEVPLKKAAEVTELPKREQLAAAKAKTEKRDEPDPGLDAWEPDEDEEAQLEQAEKDYAASVDKVMAADDKLAAAHAEIKRQAAEIAALKLSRNQFQNRCDELVKRIKKLQRENERLKKRA